MVDAAFDPEHAIMDTPQNQPLGTKSLGCLGLHNPLRQACLHIAYTQGAPYGHSPRTPRAASVSLAGGAPRLRARALACFAPDERRDRADRAVCAARAAAARAQRSRRSSW